MTSRAKHRDPRARLGLTSKASAADAKRAHGELVDYLKGAPEGLRRWARDEIAAADDAYAALTRPARKEGARRASPLKRVVVGVVTLAVVVGVVVGIYNLGGGSGDEKSQQGGATEAASLSPNDEFRVAKLMRKLQTKPNDVTVLVALGNIYFNVRDFEKAAGWMQRALSIDSKNVDARLALGASEFNLQNVPDARRNWLRVVALDPKNVEAYYDLGFLYVSEDPPNMAKTKEMWGKVVELAPPDSQIAKNVATHLKGLEKAEKSGSISATSPASQG